MEPIRKTIVYKPGDRKNRLVLTTQNRYTLLALLALPIIAGLETYYRNLCGDPGTTYIGGLWTFSYGISWLLTFILHREARKRHSALLEQQGQNIEETIQFSNDTFETSVDGFYSYHYPWSWLSSFRDSKRYWQFTLAGIEHMIPKKYFTYEERNRVTALLKAKRSELTKHMPGDKDDITELTPPRTYELPKRNRKTRLPVIIAVVGVPTAAACLLLIVVGIFYGFINGGKSNDNRIAECNLEKLETQAVSTDSFIVAIEDCFWKKESVINWSLTPPFIQTTENRMMVIDMDVTNRLSQDLDYGCELFDAESNQPLNNPSRELFTITLWPGEGRFRMEFLIFPDEGQNVDLHCHSAVLENGIGADSIYKRLDEVVFQIQ